MPARACGEYIVLWERRHMKAARIPGNEYLWNVYKCNVMVQCCSNVDYPIIICSQLQSMWHNYVCTLTCCGWSLSRLLLCRCILWNRCRSEHVNAEVYMQKTYYVKQKLTKLLMLHPVCYFVYPLHKMQYSPLPRQHNVMRVLLKSLFYGDVA